MIRKRFAGVLMAAMAVGTIATAVAPLAGASVAHPAAVSHQAVLADTNGQPDPAPITLDPDVALAMSVSSSPSLGIVDNSGTEFTGNDCASGTPIKFIANGNTFTWGGVTYRVGTLNEPGQSPACLGFNGFGN